MIPSQILELLRRHGITPRKRLGQHFLADPNIVDKIVRIAEVGPGDLVVEVGAGTGVLTRALAETGAQVVAYEVDRAFTPVLREVVGDYENVDIRFENALTALPVGLNGGPWTMVANLPYNVGTPLLLETIRHGFAIERFVVMVQDEVAERLVAKPGSRIYGIPSIVAALHTTARRAFTVTAQVFVPPPRVSSSIVILDRRKDIDRSLAERAIELAATAFQQRRKMMRRLVPLETLESAGIAPQARPEDLSPEDYLRLAHDG